VKKLLATVGLLSGLALAPGFVATAHAGDCHRRSHGYDQRYHRYDSGYDDDRYSPYYEDDRYVRVEPRYRYVPRTYVYESAPRAAISVGGFPPFFGFFFGR
jgi:hypothetical protein